MYGVKVPVLPGGGAAGVDGMTVDDLQELIGPYLDGL